MDAEGSGKGEWPVAPAEHQSDARGKKNFVGLQLDKIVRFF